MLSFVIGGGKRLISRVNPGDLVVNTLAFTTIGEQFKTDRLKLVGSGSQIFQIHES